MDFPPFKEIQFNLELNLRSGSNTATEREKELSMHSKLSKHFKEISGYEDDDDHCEESYQRYQRVSKFSEITNYFRRIFIEKLFIDFLELPE